MVEQSLRISLQDPEDPDTIDDLNVSDHASISLALDDTKNNSVTSFLYADKAYFKVYAYHKEAESPHTPNDPDTEIIISDGTLSSEGSGYEEITEFIVVSNEKTANTTKAIDSIVSATWLGRSLGSVVSTGGTGLQFSSAGYAVLEIVYKTKFKRYAVTLPSREVADYRVAAWGIVAGQSSYLSITYQRSSTTESETGDEVSVILNVKDYCSGLDVDGVAVYINNVYKGVTGAEGTIDLGSMARGTYTLKMTKAGYKDSGQDALVNDSFTV